MACARKSSGSRILPQLPSRGRRNGGGSPCVGQTALALQRLLSLNQHECSRATVENGVTEREEGNGGNRNASVSLRARGGGGPRGRRRDGREGQRSVRHRLLRQHLLRAAVLRVLAAVQ